MSETIATTVSIPSSLRTLTNGNAEVQATGATVGLVIEMLEKSYPGLRDRLLDAKGVRSYVTISVNDEDIRFLDGLSTQLITGDRIDIQPAVAG